VVAVVREQGPAEVERPGIDLHADPEPAEACIPGSPGERWRIVVPVRYHAPILPRWRARAAGCRYDEARMDREVVVRHKHYFVPASMTGAGMIVMENKASAAP
jgi:hypothetical protein